MSLRAQEVPMVDDAPVLLETRGLTKNFGPYAAIRGVGLVVAEGSVHALVGPSGAGKTTLFNLLTGFLTPTAGSIHFRGEPITGRRPEQIAHLGITRAPRALSLLGHLTLADHVGLALARAPARGRGSGHEPSRRPVDLLAEVGLAALGGAPVSSLATAQRRALELALALAPAPRLLLLDEPTTGLGVDELDHLIALVRRVAAGRTLLVADHAMRLVREIADSVTLLESGRVTAQGDCQRVLRGLRAAADTRQETGLDPHATSGPTVVP